MVIKNLTEGQVIKNYKELCNLLDMPVKVGNTKLAQLKELERYCKYKKIDNFTSSTFKMYKLGGMVTQLFNGDSYNALQNAYPNIKIWQLNNMRCYRYFKKEKDGVKRAKDAIDWMLKELEKDGYIIKKEKLLQYDWKMFFKKYKMSDIINITFNDNYKDFFKECFDIEYNNCDVYRYILHFKLNKGKSKRLIM